MDAASATVGVEEEFLLADPATGAPAAKNVEVARSAKDIGIDLQLELTRCQVETCTGVHTETAELLDELRELRSGVAGCAREHDTRLLAVAIPPTVPEQFPVTDTPRYQRIARNFGMLAHEQGLCGCHIHVGIPDRETAVQVSNFLRPSLPVFLALTANSSIYRGSETGYASWRSVLWRRWPSAGPPPYFADAEAYDTMVEMMLSSGSILDKKMVYWDIRPSSTFPTVEIRVSDVPATVQETALLATLVRAAVMTARAELDRGRTAPMVSAEVLRTAYWKAARSGLDGDGVDPIDGRIAPSRMLLAELLDRIAPALTALNAEDFVTEAITAVLDRGNGACRQRAAFRARREVGDVLAVLQDATLEGCP
ncbi:glutamate--cysteine ligase [Nocardia cyriacigeorgica]|uniref:Putative glutamate--cysteine ligase 2 n=1 Tax=Nocardia cyriacigeorgica TaxID=135487 RepID=A0ABX0CSP4_9NOCA|nr:glutamate--cysteine ligase [Nocardia cyriacigeorgica]NEW39766.1 glutamate--cysteine ligase [Nocardia cyriacigeorgica]NEW52400.1 glutamate--cysteine ligase [Nocardia cyriacigeorgica]NEW59501.1 glutamate--cysteine ligase [Nocardia cyriacigeorgica]